MADQSTRLWGARFRAGPSSEMMSLSRSEDSYFRMVPYDLVSSAAHANELVRAGILKPDEAGTIAAALASMGQEYAAGQLQPSAGDEDVHTFLERVLAERVGPLGGKLRAGRSRNDQAANDLKLYLREVARRIALDLLSLQDALVGQATANAETLAPGFTHLQPAQPVTFGHHLLAYVEMIGRDRGRFADARKRLNESPLGSAALAGTSFPIDRQKTAEALGFDKPMANSLDGVSDRDFVLETLAAATIAAVHFSRLAEEIVIWMTPQFGFVKLSDRFTTGSSIMPQKRNPDAAELARAKVGRIAGAFQSLVIVMKGLPLAYSKDMQEDKEATFDALSSLRLVMAAMAGMIADLEPNPEAMRAAAGRGYATATDLADWLVKELKMPFRDAHHVTGAIVKAAEAKGVDLDALALSDMQAVEPRITKAVFSVLSVENSVKSRTSYGGTAPQNVAKMARQWLRRLEKARGKG